MMDFNGRFCKSAALSFAYLLLGAIPQSSVDGVSGDVRPVDVAIFGIPVQRHSIAHISQRDDIIGHVLCIKADSSDVRPSGKKQELVKT